MTSGQLPRYLIVNADDFGMSAGVNAGVAAAFEHGILTAASLLVSGEAVEEAVSYAKQSPGLDLGLHLDLGEYVFDGSGWTETYRVVDRSDHEAISSEIRAQIDKFYDLTGTQPSHIDSHQNVHRKEPIRSLLNMAAKEIGATVRELSDSIAFFGGFYGLTRYGEPIPDSVTVERLIQIIHNLPPGITELGCHPGVGEEPKTFFMKERNIEVATLRDPRIPPVLESEEVILCTFRDIDGVLD